MHAYTISIVSSRGYRRGGRDDSHYFSPHLQELLKLRRLALSELSENLEQSIKIYKECVKNGDLMPDVNNVLGASATS